MTHSFARFRAVAMLAIPAVVACGASGQILSVGTDLQNADGGGDGGSGATDAGAAPCTSAAQCGPDAACGFPPGAACGSVGACFSTQGIATCEAYQAGCACDGSEINLICTPLPQGYTTKPVAHVGACETVPDAAAPCASDTDCGPQGVCGFPRAQACQATRGICFPIVGANCGVFLPGCACDGTAVNLACNHLPSDYAPKPLAHQGTCEGG